MSRTPPAEQFDERGMPHGATLVDGWEIAPRDVQRLREAGHDFLLLDVRTAQERDLARISDSMHIPLQEIAASLPRLREHEDRAIVVHCHHGVRSFQVTEFLRREGFADVRSLAGGIDLWARAIDPAVGRY